MEKKSYKEWLEINKKEFKFLKIISKKYKTWNDVQKNSTEKEDIFDKSYIWKKIKNFRKSENNKKAYEFKKINGKIALYGWIFGKWEYMFGQL